MLPPYLSYIFIYIFAFIKYSSSRIMSIWVTCASGDSLSGPRILHKSNKSLSPLLKYIAHRQEKRVEVVCLEEIDLTCQCSNQYWVFLLYLSNKALELIVAGRVFFNAKPSLLESFFSIEEVFLRVVQLLMTIFAAFSCVDDSSIRHAFISTQSVVWSDFNLLSSAVSSSGFWHSSSNYD